MDRNLSYRTIPFGLLMVIAAVAAAPAVLRAQDSLPPVEQGVRIGITYTPGVRPGLLVLGGSRSDLLDSVRAIIRRDLDYSDRFELIMLPGGGGGGGGGGHTDDRDLCVERGGGHRP